MKISLALAALTLALAGSPAGGRAADDPQRVAAQAELQRAVDPAVVALLEADPPVAARAALALGRSRLPAARPVLRAHLVTPDATVRAMVAYALGLTADPESLPQERDLARNDPSSAVRYAALDAIDRIVAANPMLGTREVADDVIAAASSDPDAGVRGHAAISTQAFRDRPDAAELASGLAAAYGRERDATVRWHLMWAIFRGYAKDAPRIILIRGLHDRSDVVRVEALRAWGKRTSRKSP